MATVASVVATVAQLMESVSVDGSPTLSGEVAVHLGVSVAEASKSLELTESGHSVLFAVHGAATHLVESVVLDGSPSLADEVLLKSAVVVSFSSESFPVSESETSGFFSDTVLLELSGVDLGFTEEAGGTNSGSDSFINNDGLDELLGDGLGGDDWLNKFDSLLQVDGLSDGDLLHDRDVVSDFDLLSEGLGFEGIDFLHSGDRFNDFNHLLDGDVFNNLNSLGDKSGFNDFDFLSNDSGFNNLNSLSDGDSLSVLDLLKNLCGLKDLDVLKAGSGFYDINFLHESSGFDDLLLFSEQVSFRDGSSSNDFSLNNGGLLNDNRLLNDGFSGKMSLFVDNRSALNQILVVTVSLGAHRVTENSFQQDLTSRLVLVGQGVPSAGLTAGLELSQVNEEAANVVITRESVLVHKLNNNLGLVTNGDGNSISPVGVLASLLADLSLEDAITDDESAVGAHLTDQVSVVGKVGFNRSESNGAGHRK